MRARTTKAGGRTFRTRPRKRRACPGRVLHHRIGKPEGTRLRRRNNVVCWVPIRAGEV